MDNNFVFGYNIPTKILFGCGELKRLSTEALPGKKALIIIRPEPQCVNMVIWIR